MVQRGQRSVVSNREGRHDRTRASAHSLGSVSA